MLSNFRTYQLAVQLYRECETLRLKSHLRDQLSRAALSVVLNIAEGSAKPTPKERRRFYSIALASTREVQAVLSITDQRALFGLSDQVGACLYRLVHPH